MFGVQARVSEEDCGKYVLRKLNCIHYDNYNQRIRCEGKVTLMGEAGRLGKANFSVRVSFVNLHMFHSTSNMEAESL